MLWRRLIPTVSVAAAAVAHAEWKTEAPFENNLCLKVERATFAIQQFMVRGGLPGLSVGVSVNGQRVWSSGFGYADVEQMVPCTGQTVMRIASISKTITAIIAARLVEAGKLDLEAPIQKYLADFPKKKFEGNDVEITSRQLLCHTSGIRHYRKQEDRQGIEDPEEKENEAEDGKQSEKANNGEKETEKTPPEFLSNKRYRTVSDALAMFKDDELVSRPGSTFLYSTNGFTLLSAVLENAAGEPFSKQAMHFFRMLGMNSTTLDENRVLTPFRARYYYRDRHHKLKNAPEVDNSYKWAGGGFLSNVNDLLVFANALLYSFHSSSGDVESRSLKPVVGSETLRAFWKGEVDGKNGMRYGLGWYKSGEEERLGGAGWTRNGFWMHTGAAVGASSVLLIKPLPSGANTDGVCVAVVVNLHECSELTKLALEIAEIFQS